MAKRTVMVEVPTPTPEPPRIALTVEEAAAAVGLGRSTMWDLVRAGAIPHRKVGRRVLVGVEALRRWVDEAAS